MRLTIRNWLLTLAVQSPIPLRLVYGSRKYLWVQWNHPVPTMDLFSLIRELDSLQSEGLIEFYHPDDFTEPVKLSPEQISKSLRELTKSSHDFRLTLLGGEMWERAAHPDWNRYYTIDFHDLSPEVSVVRLSAANLEDLEKIKIVLLINFDEYVEHSTQPPNPTSKLVPWAATYWKVLPEGAQLELVIQERLDNSFDNPVGPYGRELSDYFTYWHERLDQVEVT